jgi:hypothetical protein
MRRSLMLEKFNGAIVELVRPVISAKEADAPTIVVDRRQLRFYEKVIKVKADVAVLNILFSPTSTRLRPVAWRTVKGSVCWRSSRPLTGVHATS